MKRWIIIAIAMIPAVALAQSSLETSKLNTYVALDGIALETSKFNTYVVLQSSATAFFRPSHP